jgi:hypothetical protein
MLVRALLIKVVFLPESEIAHGKDGFACRQEESNNVHVHVRVKVLAGNAGRQTEAQ